MAVFEQKQAKWGQSKQPWHPNLQTFFDEVIIFELMGDDVKICYRQTDKFFDTISRGVRIFSFN